MIDSVKEVIEVHGNLKSAMGKRSLENDRVAEVLLGWNFGPPGDADAAKSNVGVLHSSSSARTTGSPRRLLRHTR